MKAARSGGTRTTTLNDTRGVTAGTLVCARLSYLLFNGGLAAHHSFEPSPPGFSDFPVKPGQRVFEPRKRWLGCDPLGSQKARR